MIDELINKYPGYWLEIERNPISEKWLVRIAESPSHNNQLPNNIYLGIGNSIEEAIRKIL